MKYVIVILIVLAILYFIFKDKVNDFVLGFLNKDSGGFTGSCSKTFFAKLPDGKTISVVSADTGTTDAPVIKYYKKNVTIVEGGIENPGTQVEIAKDEFEGYCKYIYHPPYEWYKGTHGEQSSGPNRTYQSGGMAIPTINTYSNGGGCGG